jgi:hypothetical protein
MPRSLRGALQGRYVLTLYEAGRWKKAPLLQIVLDAFDDRAEIDFQSETIASGTALNVLVWP